MRTYRERLAVPASWWLLGELSAATLASTAWAGFDLAIASASYLLFCGGTAAILLAWGAASVTVADGQLRAGRWVLDLADVAEVQVLDQAQFRALCGPRADPAARLLIRPYLSRGVYLGMAGTRPVPPYWLIGTRQPDELAAAVSAARPQARAAGAPCDDRLT